MDLQSYINKRTAHGLCYFVVSDARKALGKSINAIRHSIAHFTAKGEIVSPAQGFYVIIPPEYRILGYIPAEQFIS